MANCKYCGHETGSKMFCEYCGAKVDKAPTPPTPPTPPVPPVPPTPPVMPQPQFQPASYQQPILNQMPMQQAYYTPHKTGGLLAGNIVVLVLSCIFFCSIFPLVSIPLSIIGIVFSVKAGNSRSVQEENASRMVAMIMLIIGAILLVLGIMVFIGVVEDRYGGFEEFFDEVFSGD
ncbi:MAG: hypothetical protein J6Y58_11535 [Clostridiales bacterium]|nr:hypothetical protein [Clostridiales bacterium]